MPTAAAQSQAVQTGNGDFVKGFLAGQVILSLLLFILVKVRFVLRIAFYLYADRI